MSAGSGFILGLDMGVASIGWSVVELDASGRPFRVRRAGVHLFDAGVEGGKLDPERAMTLGREQSKAKPRRDARAMRRQTWRRARRKKKVLGALIRHGLLPEGEIRTPAEIDQYLKSIDARLRATWESAENSHSDRQKLPYRLREAAAARAVEPHEFGRALYHLAQRRGFLSNRKAPEREDDRSDMKQQIGDLARRIAEHNPPTLGAYLCSLDPDEERIRQRWTSRAMYEEEFEHMWREQGPALGLSDAARDEIYNAIFHQRPLKDQRHLVGRCSLTGKPRCPMGMRIAQRFRVLQQVNHLRVITDDLTERALGVDERRRLIDALCEQGDLTIAAAKRAAGLPSRGAGAVVFSIERGGERKLVGHRTDAKLRDVFGSRWDDLSEAEKDAVVQDVRSVRLPETLERMGRERWGLDPESATRLGGLELEEGHSAHSRAALLRLVPRMDEDGLSYSEARRDEFPEAFRSDEPREALPPLSDWGDDLRNPSVARALTELRKLVNAVVRRYGKPARIHVELARDLKAGRSKRERLSKRMREREAERSRAADEIMQQPGFERPRRWQIEKWLLAEECGWRCPFTGREFGARDLLGPTSQYDVEHIWPFSQSLDNSFLNKTICYHEENRQRKRGHSPLRAYGGTPEAHEAMLQRVRAFRGDRFVVREKLRRFEEDVEPGFTNRHLAETRFIARLACDYLGLLYGGRVEAMGSGGSTKRIVTPSGGLTAWLRRGWGLDAVLSDRGEKDRRDHRHHAVDAIVIALADDSSVKRLADAARRMEGQGRERPFDTVEPPWPSLVEDVRAVVEAIVVSHRQSRKIRGKLHQDTLYSRDHGGRRRVSKELWKLTKTEVERGKVVDRRALEAIREKLGALGQDDPSKAFQDRANLPRVRGAAGRLVPLRRVRVEVRAKPRRFGSGCRERYAATDSNHHMAFYDRRVPGGGVQRIAEVVSLPDAMDRRSRSGDGVVDRADRGEFRFAFSLAPGETVELRGARAGDPARVCRVLRISENDLELAPHHDGRTTGERQGDRIRLRKGAIAEAGFRKVYVDYLGEVHDAGG